eukprot:11170613-Lingulodinium_polyedra.AAC.1
MTATQKSASSNIISGSAGRCKLYGANVAGKLDENGAMAGGAGSAAPAAVNDTATRRPRTQRANERRR